MDFPLEQKKRTKPADTPLCGEALYTRAVEYILLMPKTEKSVRLWLGKRTADKDEIETTISKLKEYNFVDDKNYARMFVDAKKGKMGVGQIKNKLLQKGVGYNVVDIAVAEIGDQFDLAKITAGKYLRGKPKTPEIKGKLFRYMLSKGFGYELSGEVSSECWNRHCGS